MPTTDPSRARLVGALEAIEDAAAINAERSREVERRARLLLERLRAGDDVVDVISGEKEPRMVELVTANMTALETVGAEVRAAQALALRAEGMTIADIADLFGVSRQRISALLKQRAAVVGV